MQLSTGLEKKQVGHLVTMLAVGAVAIVVAKQAKGTKGVEGGITEAAEATVITMQHQNHQSHQNRPNQLRAAVMDTITIKTSHLPLHTHRVGKIALTKILIPGTPESSLPM